MNIEGFSRWIMPKIRSFERYNPGVYIEFIPVDENNMGDIIHKL